MMALPPVFVGLVLYVTFSQSGFPGFYEYTVTHQQLWLLLKP